MWIYTYQNMCRDISQYYDTKKFHYAVFVNVYRVTVASHSSKQISLKNKAQNDVINLLLKNRNPQPFVRVLGSLLRH